MYSSITVHIYIYHNAAQFPDFDQLYVKIAGSSASRNKINNIYESLV